MRLGAVMEGWRGGSDSDVRQGGPRLLGAWLATAVLLCVAWRSGQGQSGSIVWATQGPVDGRGEANLGRAPSVDQTLAGYFDGAVTSTVEVAAEAQLDSLVIWAALAENPATTPLYVEVWRQDTNQLVATSNVEPLGYFNGAFTQPVGFGFSGANRIDLVPGIPYSCVIRGTGQGAGTLIVSSSIYQGQYAGEYFEVWGVPPQSFMFGLEQQKPNGTSIKEGRGITERVVTFSANVESLSQMDPARLEIELLPFAQPFAGNPNLTSAFVASGATARVSSASLADGQYHWQARVVDVDGNASSWQELGTAGNVDLVVSADTPGIAGNFSDGGFPNGYCGHGAVAVVPDIDLQITTVDFWAICANGICTPPNDFQIWSADNSTLLATSDGQGTYFGYPNNKEITQTFSGANQITLRAGQTYLMTPFSANGGCIVDEYDGAYDTFYVRGVPDVSAQPACGSPYGSDDDTVALWRLDDGAGATVAHDASGHHHDGAIQGTPGTISGPFGSSFLLGQQGSGRWISVPSASDLDGFAEVTVEAWIFPTDQIGGPHDLVAKGPHTGSNPGQVEFEYELNSVQPPAGDPAGLRIAFFVGGANGSVEADSTVTHPFNEWLYVAGTYDGHVARIYINGQLEGVSSQVDGLSVSNTHPVLIDNQDVGASPGDDGGIPGGFAEVRISKRARSGQEFAAAWANHSSSCAINVDAGASTTIQVGQLATVSGASVSSSVCTPVPSWSFAARPAGSAATLQNAETLTPSFTPDVAGTYTLTLTASCGTLSQNSEVTINALACIGNELFVNPRDARVPVGGVMQFSATLPGSTYTWSLPSNLSGATLSPASGMGPTITYQAGAAPAQDVLRVTSSVCGHTDITITTFATTPPEPLDLSITPSPTFGAAQIQVFQTFSSQVDAAEACIDPSGSPPPGSCKSVPVSANAAIGPLDVGTLSTGQHFLAMRGHGGGQWGPLGAPTPFQVIPDAAILLLNGYKPCGVGPHPEEWWQDPAVSPPIPCQLAAYAFNDTTCSAANVANRCARGATGPRVCVVDNLDGRGDVPCNVQYLREYIYGDHPDNRSCQLDGPILPPPITPRAWLANDAVKLILIGQSYGGQIARAFAAAYPDKVLGVITLDTPYLGAGFIGDLNALLPWLKDAPILGPGLGPIPLPLSVCDLVGGFHPTPYDDAAQYFDDDRARDFSNTLVDRVPMAAIGSQGYAHDVTVNFAPLLGGPPLSPVKIPNATDNIVPLASQLAQCPIGASCNFDSFSGRRQTLTLGSPGYYSLALAPLGLQHLLHLALFHDEGAWGPTFDAVKAFLARLGVPAGAQAHTAARGGHATRRDSSTSPPIPLPSANPSQVITTASGTLDLNHTSASLTFDVDTATELVVTVSAQAMNLNLGLAAPSGTVLTSVSCDGLTTFYASAQDELGLHQSFLVRSPQAGSWTLSLVVPAAGGGPHLPAIGSPWSVVVTERSPLSLVASTADSKYLPAETVSVQAALTARGLPVTGAAVIASIASPSGAVIGAFTLYDDGEHGDGAAGDGVYGGSVVAPDAGSYLLTVSATGASPVGNFGRQATATFSVGSAGATVSGPFVEAAPDADGDGQYDALGWSFTANVPGAGNYSCLGDLLAADGSRVAKAATSFTTGTAGSIPVTLSFSGRDIYRQAKLGPYTLANLQITVSTPNGERLSGRPADRLVSAGPYWSWMSFERDPAPAFTWSYPVAEEIVTTNTATLKWSVFDGNGATTLDLYYDTTGSGFAGTPIATGIPAVQGAMSYVWDLSGLPDGAYYVYVRIRNGDYSSAVYGGNLRKLLDSDGDGMPDAWESAHGLDPANPGDAYLDPDGDGLANVDEYVNGTDPHVADTDGGGESDLSEAVNGRNGTDPTDDVTGITLVSVSPHEGDSRGGEQVLVLGSGFVPGAAVTFDGQPAAAVSFVNSTRLVATTPPHAVGAVTVAVTNPAAGGTSALPSGFTYLCDFVEAPTASNSGPFCPRQTLQLSAGGLSGAAFQWTGPNGFTSTERNPAISNATAAAAGSYTVVLSVGSCQLSAATVAVSSAPPAPTATNNGPLCSGQALQLSASSVQSGSYSWTGPNNFSSSQQNPLLPAAGAASSGTYAVTATVNGCSSSPATTDVLVRPLPGAAVSGSAQICSGVATTIQAGLTGAPPWTLLWSDGVTQAGIAAAPATRSVHPGTTTTYSVTSLSDAYCAGTASGSAVITVTSPPAPTLGNDGPACAGQDVHLSAGNIAGATFAWSGPGGFSSSAQNPILTAAQPAASGTYSATATLNGCVSQAGSTSVLVRALSTGTVTGSTRSCPGTADSIQAALTGTAPWSLRWSDGFSQPSIASSPASRLVSPTVNTTYTLASISDAYCPGSASGSAVISIDDTCSQFYTLPPCRVIDTRTAVGPLGGPALQPFSVRGFPVIGSCGIPAGAKVLSVNVTIVQGAAPGDLRLYPGDLSGPPLASTLNWSAGATRANNAIVKMPANGSGTIDVRLDSLGSAQFIMDVNGYFQ